MPSRRTAIIVVGALLLALVATAILLWRAPLGPAGSGVALVGGPFELTNQDGTRVTDKDFRGHSMLVFFGYTFCPDVCPTTLQVMTQALDRMGPSAANIQPVFVTIDPDRDTPPVMKAYVANFSPRLVGLTGSPDDIARVARAYRVAYSKQETGDSKNYLMDHSSIIYLMGPDGAFVKFFTYTTDADRLAKDIAAAASGSS